MRNAAARNCVLVVDDDPAVRDTCVRMLRDAGYQVVAVSEGQGALQALSDDPTIGVILLDLDMPGVDGVAVRRAQLADPELATIPTVIISGQAAAASIAANFRPTPTFPSRSHGSSSSRSSADIAHRSPARNRDPATSREIRQGSGGRLPGTAGVSARAWRE